MKLVNMRFTTGGRGGLLGWRFGLEAFGILWCLERSTVYVGDEKYLTRNILYAFGGTLRLHKFWRGDNDAASHTHPWNFWTFPLRSYLEDCFYFGTYVGRYKVRSWQWHPRRCYHEHIVVERADGSGKPFYTLVVTGPKINDWGFYPEPGKFIYWRDYNGAA